MDWGCVIGFAGICIGVATGAVGWAFRTQETVTWASTKLKDMKGTLEDIRDNLASLDTKLDEIGKRLATVEVTLLNHGRRIAKLEK